MAKYIDADLMALNESDAYMSAQTKTEDPILLGLNSVVHRKIQQLIADTPAADAVEVVRCRECKHHRDKNEQEQQYLVEDILICTSPDATDDCWNAVWPDHFCSYGERKEGANNG